MFGIWRKSVWLLVSGIILGCVQAEPLEEWRAQQGRRIALPDLIKLISGHEVYDWDEAQAPTFRKVGETVLAEVAENPIRAKRINEVGNAVELYVIAALEKSGLEAGRPTPPSGRKKTAGYPDLYAIVEEDYFYLEIKTYSSKTVNSSQRTFYISPSEDFKVAKDGYHLLLAFSTEEVEQGVYLLTGFKLLDLYGLECRLKLEFNASNKNLYDPESGLIVVEE
ncbi:MAG: hypothetical protein O7C75_12560 [Verrucomicrobia bacterium]|nr:hypothetical protein [Verrucomicrobiota bacterium]